MFAHRSLKAKILALTAFQIAISILVGVLGWYSLKSTSTKYNQISETNLPDAINLAAIRGAAKDITRNIVRLALPDLPQEEVKMDLATIDKHQEDMTKVLEEFLKTEPEEEEKPLIANVRKIMPMFVAETDQIQALVESQDPGKRKAGVDMINSTYRVTYNELFKALNDLVEYQKKNADENVAEARAETRKGNFLILLVTLAGGLFSLLVGRQVTYAISNSLSRVSSQILAGSAEVASASKMLSDSSVKLSESSTEQSSALQETVASVEEIAAMIRRNTENAQNSQKCATQSKEIATQGKETVQQVIQAIGEIDASNTDIQRQVEESNQQISEIVKVIAEIGNKTKVINDIVFQTKLLSFNASVEAARAGEHGKGFAVVAEEVGNLAQMSGNAAKEISQLLETSIRKVESIVLDTKTKVGHMMGVARDKVKSGTVIAHQSGETLGQIVSSVDEVSKLVEEIATASQEQSTGISEINKAMTQLDQTTHQNTSISHETASTSEELTQQAESLKGQVAELVATIEGTHEKAAPRVSTPVQAKRAAPARRPVSKPVVNQSPAPMITPVAEAGVPSESDSRFKDV